MSDTSRRDVIRTIYRAVPVALLGPRLRAQVPSPALRERTFSVPLVNENGERVVGYNASSAYFAEDLGDGVVLDMAAIPGGVFMMGSGSATSFGNLSAQPRRQVSVSPFFLGSYEVTRGQWRQVSKFLKVSTDLQTLFRYDFPPLNLSLEEENRLPVDAVFHHHAEEFCARLRNHTGRDIACPPRRNGSTPAGQAQVAGIILETGLVCQWQTTMTDSGHSSYRR
jgi:formylglycine-generating enzyme required for sulfatase activity